MHGTLTLNHYHSQSLPNYTIITTTTAPHHFIASLSTTTVQMAAPKSGNEKPSKWVEMDENSDSDSRLDEKQAVEQEDGKEAEEQDEDQKDVQEEDEDDVKEEEEVEEEEEEKKGTTPSTAGAATPTLANDVERQCSLFSELCLADNASEMETDSDVESILYENEDENDSEELDEFKIWSKVESRALQSATSVCADLYRTALTARIAILDCDAETKNSKKVKGRKKRKNRKKKRNQKDPQQTARRREAKERLDTAHQGLKKRNNDIERRCNELATITPKNRCDALLMDWARKQWMEQMSDVDHFIAEICIGTFIHMIAF